MLALVTYIGNGAHLLAASVASLDLDEREREELHVDQHCRVRDLPDAVRRRLLRRREKQIHVRRIPAMPQERGARADDFIGNALADILVAGHSLSRRFSHVAGAPHRVIDIASSVQLATLYRQGPRKAALDATALMLGRSVTAIRALITQAKVHGLVVPENTRQAE
jgi:hypothetical protein